MVEYLAGKRVKGTSSERISFIYDNFNDNSLDTSKWTKTDTSNRLTESNGKIEFSTPHNSSYTAILQSVNSLSASVYSLQGKVTGASGNAPFNELKLWFNSTNYASINTGGVNTSDHYYLFVLDNNSAVVSNVTTGITTGKDVKITLDTVTNQIKFWYWSGSAWVQMGSTYTYEIDDGNPAKIQNYFYDYSTYDGTGLSTDDVYLFSGLSNDHYPTIPAFQDGTIFEETDTNKAYIWNATTAAWTQL